VGLNNHYLRGEVADVRKWSSVRTAQEIHDYYTQQLSLPQQGLEGYWKIKEGTGVSIGESTGNYTAASVQPSNNPMWIIDSIPATVRGTASHRIGPDLSRPYELNTYNVGPGYNLCPIRQDIGHTSPYKIPTLVSDSSRPDSMRIYWENFSDAVSNYRVFRNGKLLGLIDSTAETWADVYKFENATSLENAQTYRYCLVPFSTSFNLVFDSVCISGSTLPVNFAASDNTDPDHIHLTWSDMSDFGDNIRILRDGNFFARFDSNVTSYTDMNPLPGFRHVYQFQLLRGNHVAVAVSDTGSVPARGTIYGRVITATGDYALTGVLVTASATINGQTFTYTDTSSLTGYFRFEEVYFATGATYTVSATPPAGYSITNGPQASPLSFANPAASFIFKGTKVITPTGNGPLTFSNFNAQHLIGQDLIRLTWDYTNPDTTWFKVYRDSELIDILVDADTKPLTEFKDLTGIPGSTYTYEVVAYSYDSDTVVTEKSGSDTELMDGLAAVVPLNAIADAGQGTVHLDWVHSSLNITGFKLYRGADTTPIAIILLGATYAHTDWYGLPGENYVYGIRAFSIIEGVSYHSPITYSSQVTYPGLIAPNPVLATPYGPDDYMSVTWEYDKSDNSNFFGFRLERTGGGETDTLAHYHKEFISGETNNKYLYSFTDLTGKPGVSYTYRVYAYKQTPFAQSAPGSDTKTFPNISLPHNFTATTNLHTGYVKLAWEDNSDNHQGFLLKRNGDTLAWLPRNVLSYVDVFTTSGSTPNYTYTLHAYREVKGIRYLSSASSVTGRPKSLATNQLLAPQNFKASDVYTNHVMLSWDYPSYNHSEFYIYKDGVLLDSLENSLRVYFDTAVVTDRDYVYQIQANYKPLAIGRHVYRCRPARYPGTGGRYGPCKYRNRDSRSAHHRLSRWQCCV
jgi:hypothetical protein